MEYSLNRSNLQCGRVICAFFAGLLVVALPTGCATQPATVQESPAAADVEAEPERQDVLAELGIEIHRVAMTAQGMFIDFRYRVTDAEKAKFILRRTTTEYVALIHQESGQGVDVFQGIGKLSKLKQTTYAPEVGRIYSMIFRNPGMFRTGDQVTLVVGDHRVQDILLE